MNRIDARRTDLRHATGDPLTTRRAGRPLATLLVGTLAVAGAACSSSSDAAVGDAGDAGATVAPAGSTVRSATDPDTGSSASSESSASSTDGLAVFDPSVVHEISVVFDQDAYDEIVATFTATGEKKWIEAAVTIDGTTYEQVGLRLKGNSSLMGLRDVGAADRGGPGGSASADTPEELPWLIRLDAFVDGQTHQSYEDLVVRSNNSETSLNEAVALALLEDAGLASQRSMATRFTVNDGEAALRLVIEHPSDDQWYESNFDGDGALYKAESGGDWSYRGDEPEAYEDVFDQEGGGDVADLTPLTDFLDFVNSASDEEFTAELPERLDVDAFATYLAMMDLLENSDDIDGPGNNAYLWWDAGTEQFTVVPWDLNLAFGRGGFGGGPGGGRADDRQPPPGGGTPDRGGPGFGGGSNPLVERFLAVEEFASLVTVRSDELRAELIDGGVLDALVSEWSELLVAEAGDLVSAGVVEQEAAGISAH